MEPSVITGVLGVAIGGWLTHYFTNSREAYARRYSFKEKQLSEFYAPILAHVTQLVVGWELVEHLQNDRDRVIKAYENLDFESQERLLAPVAERHRKQYVEQLELLTKCCDIAQNCLHLAEPSTRSMLKPLFRLVADSKTVREFHIPIDATGQAIASPGRPFSENLKQLFYEIETVYRRLSAELRSGRLTTALPENQANNSEISVIEKEFSRPVLTVRKVGIRLGEKSEGFPVPAENIQGSFQYTVPIYLKNEGTVPLKEFYLRLKVPTCLLIPSAQYIGASDVEGEFTWFEFTQQHRQIDIEDRRKKWLAA